MVPVFPIPVPTPTIALSTPSGRKSCKPFLSLLMFPSQEAPIAPGETLQVIFSSMLSIIFSLFRNEFVVLQPLHNLPRAIHSTWHYGLEGICDWGYRPTNSGCCPLLQVLVGTPTLWCNASPLRQVCVALLCHECGYVLSWLSRTPCCSLEPHSICSLHAQAKSNRWRKWLCGICAGRCRDDQADVGGSVDNGTLGWTGISSPVSQAWCPSLVSKPYSDGVAPWSVCPWCPIGAYTSFIPISFR